MTSTVPGADGEPLLGAITEEGWSEVANQKSDVRNTAGTNGETSWVIQFKNPRGTSTSVNIAEMLQSDFDFLRVAATRNSSVESVAQNTAIDIADIVPGDSIRVVFTNEPKPTPKTGAVRWEKTDADAATTVNIGGSEWDITPVNPTGETIRVVDNESPDTAPGNGVFEVRDLPVGEYTLEETKAPEGYELITEAKTFTITADHGTTPLNLGEFKNSRKTGEVSWEKVDEEDPANYLGGSEWTITPVDPAGTAFDVVDNVGQEGYKGKDADTREGYFKVKDLSWGDYILVEKTPPVNYDPDPDEHEFTISAKSLSFSVGAIKNTLIKGSVQWDKVDEKGDPLGDTTWTITPITPSGGVITVEDNGDRDADSADGSFEVKDLKIGVYELKETVTRNGYVLDTTSYRFEITAGARHYVFENAFENRPPVIPPLPLTGGIGSDGYLIGGAIALLLTLLAVSGTQIKKRRNAHVSSSHR